MSLISNIRVPPYGNPTSKIWVVGESPGEQEEYARQPFVGPAGKKLKETFLRYGVAEDEIFYANLCNYRPQGNKFELLRGSRELKQGKEELLSLIQRHQPAVIAALGNEPLEYLCGRGPISKYRGSILASILPLCESVKVIPTYHPSYILRNPAEYPTFSADIKRIVGDAEFRDLRRTNREYFIAPAGPELERLVNEFEAAPFLACDIESIKNSPKILCHGFAISPNRAIVLPHEAIYFSYIHRLYQSNARKIFHYGIYDTEQLLRNGIEVNNWTDDTFILHHAYQPELARGLDYLTSIFTREPYYKSEGRGEIPDNTKAWSEKTDPNKLYIYNAKDACVTYECFMAIMDEVKDDKLVLEEYRYEMELTPIALEIGRNGMLVDVKTREQMQLALTQKWAQLQGILNMIAGKEINVNSTPVMRKFVFDQLGLPERKKKNAKTGKSQLTTDEDAIVSLITHCEGYIANLKKEGTKNIWRVKQQACKLVLEIRGIRKLLSSYINIPLSPDNRARSTYLGGPGTDTCRWSCMKYLDGTGLNAQTFPRDSVDVPDNLDPNFDVNVWLKQLMEESEDEALLPSEADHD